MARFAKIGGAGQTFDAGKLSPEMKAAIEQGMATHGLPMAKWRNSLSWGELS